MVTQQCRGINFIELPNQEIRGLPKNSDEVSSGTEEVTENSRRGIENDKNPNEQTQNTSDNGKKEEEYEDSDQYFDEDTFKTMIPHFNYRREYNAEDEEQGTSRVYPPVRSDRTTTLMPNVRRYWLVTAPEDDANHKSDTVKPNLEDKDANLKHKIALLVDQTMHDTELKVNSVQRAKQRHRFKAPYRIGFILSLVKKSRDVLNELFNVAVKHRDEWKALEQLKIFELIFHTNVDTTNLVRQLVEIHIQNLNATRPRLRSFDGNRQVVLM